MPGRCCLQRDALDVPERGRRRHAAGEQRLDGLEADRRRAHLLRVAARALDDRAQDRLVGRQPAHAGALALEVLRRADARLGEHGGERRLDERHHADEVAALLARQAEVVDVEDRHVGAAALEQLQRVGRRARLADRQLDALGGVEAALDRDVEAGVHRVGREVEQQRGLLVRAVLAAGAAAARAGPRAGRGGGAQPHRSQRTMGLDAPPGHLLAQPHAVALADLPVLLQVLRVRDAPAAPARARRGRAHPRRRRAAQRQGAARAHRRGARPPSRRRARACRRSATPTSPPTSSGSASARSSAGCSRTRTSACSSREDLARLREVTASQGLMLESVNPDLVAHQGSPTKHPELRLESIRAAGELKIPFTSGILVGIGETEDERVAALEALAAVHAEHGHLQEVILQNFVPHQSYYGEEPAEIAEAAATEYWRTGLGARPAARPRRRGRRRSSIEDMKRLIAEARRLLPGVGIQVPPNLADWWPELVAAGATDLGGLSANGDHISPEHPFPSPHKVRKRLAQDGVALTERLCVYPRVHRPRVGRPGRARRHQDAVLELHPAPRLGPPRRAARPSCVAGDDRARPRRRAADRRGADGDVRRDAAGGDRGHARRRRRAARRAGGGDGDVRRQPQHQRLERLHRRLRVLRLRPGQALARRLRALARGVRRARRRRRRVRRDRALHPVGHPPRLGARGLRGLAALRQGARAAAAPARVLADGGRAHVRRLRARRRARSSPGCATPGSTRRRAPPPRCSTTACASASARTSCRSRAGSRSSRPRTPRACARPSR